MNRSTQERWTRRQLIQAGGLGALGLGLPRLLAAEPAAASAKSCIFIILSGGPSHIDTWDPKPNAPKEVRGPYQAIATRTPGVQVTDMFPRLAQVSNLYSLVRCLSHAEVPHVTAAHMMLSGQPDGRRQNKLPFIGSLISKFQPSAANMPSHVWLHNMKTGTNKIPRYDSGLHLIGHEHAALRVGYELDNPAHNSAFRVKAFDPADGVTHQQLLQRLQLLKELESRREDPSIRRFQQFRERARDLVSGPAARSAFELKHEPDSLRDRYGRHPLGQYCLMARRLIEAGVRLVTVTGWPGLAPGETKPTITQVWDTHDIRYKGSDSMFGNGPFGMKWSLPRLDEALSALLDDLHQQGLLEDTLVAVVGEFGRTPKFEGKGQRTRPLATLLYRSPRWRWHPRRRDVRRV